MSNDPVGEFRMRRIESKVDALIGMVVMALGFWCADRIAAFLQRSLGWNRDWLFFCAAVTFYLGFNFWYGRIMQRHR